MTTAPNLFSDCMTHLCAQLSRGNLAELQRLGLSDDDLALLQTTSTLSAESYWRLCRNLSPATMQLQVKLDRTILRRQIVAAKKPTQEELILRFMALQAPCEMVQHLFGLSRKRYREYRALSGIENPCRRIGRPDGETIRQVRAGLQASNIHDALRRKIHPQEYLKLHQFTGLSLQILWLVIQKMR